MGVYRYIASGDGGQPSRGVLIADTPLEGRQRLRDAGLRILAFTPQRTRRRGFGFALNRRRRHEQVAEVSRYLALLLRSGVPLAESLDVLTRQDQGRLTAVLSDVRDRVTGGASLAEALGVHGEWFDNLFVSAVRVGELSGNLEESLSELAEHLRARQSLRSRLTGALTYPMILVCLGTAVVIFLMSYVIPQLLTVLAASGRPMPASTMVLKTASDFLVYHWASLIVGAVIACGLMAAVYASDAGRLLVHRAQLHVPLVGPLVRKQIIAGFAQQMALLLRTGTPFVDAVRCAAALTGNRVLAGELDQVGRCVESGSDIAPTLANSRIFPPVVIHLIGVGQDSGELTTLLGELRTRYETEVRIAVDRFTTALEPLLIVALASVVGFVVFACLMPILEATRGIS